MVDQQDEKDERNGKEGFLDRLQHRYVSGEVQHDRFQVTPTAESHFSWLRTRLSLERTMMSWIRTATALIGFGFTIVQFFHNIAHMEGVREARHGEWSRYMGLAMIGAGVLALIVALWQYRAFRRYLWEEDFKPLAGATKAPVETPAYGIALCLILIGCYAFLAVLIRAV